MGANFSKYVSGAVIPEGVTALRDFGSAGALSLTGSLTNSGSIFAFSTNNLVNTGVISAANISNQASGLISSVLPSAGIAGLNTSGLVNGFGLNLSSLQNIVNSGTIVSAGNLSLTAGNSVINNAVSGGALMQSAGLMQLQGQTLVNQGIIASQFGNINAVFNSLTNSGSIQAPSGSIGISSLDSSTLSLNNSLGLISALNTIDIINNVSVESKPVIAVSGGTLAARLINFEAPKGDIKVAVDRADGNVSVSGCTASVGVAGGTLNIAKMDLSGDPLFFNTDGDLDISGIFPSQNGGQNNGTFSTNGGDFVALASGNISNSNFIQGTDGSSPTIDASSATANGGAITIHAGVNFTGVSASDSNCSTCTYSIQSASALVAMSIFTMSLW